MRCRTGSPTATPPGDDVATDPLAPPHLDLVQTTLDNGLTVVVHQDTGSPLAAVNLWYGVGSRDEEAGRTGFAHLFEHLMFQGSQNVAPNEHFLLLERVGASLNATTSLDRTNYFETVPVEHLDLALWLEADRMGSLDVSQENLDTQREVVKEEKRQRYDNTPAGTLWPDMLHGLFDPSHPYGHAPIGSMEHLDAADLDDVVAFHRRWYGPDNAVLTVVSPLSVDDVLGRVRRYFGGIDPLGEVPPRPTGTLDPLPLPAAVHRSVPDRVTTPVVALGWRIPAYGHPDHDAAQVALAVLGYGRGSRLSRALAVDRKLVSPSARMVSGTDFVTGSALALSRFECRDGVGADEVTASTLAVVEALADDPPDADEVARARALFAVDWLDTIGSPSSRADEVSRITQLTGSAENVNTELDGALAVTPDDVARVAGQLLRADSAVVLTYVPEEAA
jgi:predicted Zn-dependent peptidase